MDGYHQCNLYIHSNRIKTNNTDSLFVPTIPTLYIYTHIVAGARFSMIGSCNPNISLSYIKYKCFWIRFDHWFPKIPRSRIICPSSLVVFVHTTYWWRETWVFMMWTAKSISLSDAQDPHGCPGCESSGCFPRWSRALQPPEERGRPHGAPSNT